MTWLGLFRIAVVSCALASACSVSDRQPGLRDRSNGQSKDPTPTDDRDSAADPDTGPKPSGSAGAQSMTACDPARPPTISDRPKGEDGADLEDIYLGLTQLTLGTASRDDALGLDLDGRCTKVPDCPGSESSGSCRPKTERVPADGRACRDNALASALSTANEITDIGPRFGLNDETINCGLRAGTFNALVRIRGYNGRADDPDVRVDWYSAGPHKEVANLKCDGANASAEPAWNRSTPWLVDAGDLKAAQTATTELPDSRYGDADAYVRDGTLVSRMPEGASLRLNGAPYRAFSLPTGGAFWMGRLGKMRGDIWHMTNGLIAGRARPEELIRAVRQTGYCEDTSELGYPFLVNYLNESADMLTSGSADTGLMCDALSFGVGFEAMQASPLGSAGFEPILECCAPGKSTEQCSATCGDGKVSGDEKCDTAIASGQPGACPTVCAPADDCTPQALSGAGCAVECKRQPTTAIGARDGCCPANANATTDSDCKASCGNNVIETGETCDPPSSCRNCAPLNSCYAVTQSGSAAACNLRCEQVKITTCSAADGCCPDGCNSNNDTDCSARCGNMMLEQLESCEAGTNRPCPTSCDDRQPCTIDSSTGNAATCSLICTHQRITAAAHGDGCCPDGASANVDDDCRAFCGNRVIEAGEQCDDGNQVAGDSCFECKTEDAGQICLMKQGGKPEDPCSQCTCTKCTREALNCYAAENATDSKLCRDMVHCAYDNKCGNPDCFCGTSSLFGCLSGLANGPCKQRIQDAAKSDSMIDIDVRGTDLNYPLGRANAVFSCRERNCKTECGLQ